MQTLAFLGAGRGIYFRIPSCVIKIHISGCAELGPVFLKEDKTNVSKVLNNVKHGRRSLHKHASICSYLAWQCTYLFLLQI